MDYKDFDQFIDENRKENEKYLEMFREELEKKGLTEKTIRRHLGNADLYINDFLPRRETLMKDGCDLASEFFGYFFIEKCMWSTPASIKTTAASLKKFYKCMLEHGQIEKDDYEELCDTIKFSLEEWQDDCAQYNDPDQDSPFDWF